MSREAVLSELIDRADKMLECINFDDNGSIVGGQMVGGNGGLVSPETRKAADAYARSRDVWKRWYAGSGDKPTGTGMEGS